MTKAFNTFETGSPLRWSAMRGPSSLHLQVETNHVGPWLGDIGQAAFPDPVCRLVQDEEAEVIRGYVGDT